MRAHLKVDDYHGLLDAKLTELGLYAKELFPDSVVEISAIRYEDEDGHVSVFPLCSLDDEEEERRELALAERAAEVFADTGLYILCAVLDRAALGPASISP